MLTAKGMLAQPGLVVRVKKKQFFFFKVKKAFV